MRQWEIINISHPVAKPRLPACQPRLPPWRTQPPKLKIKNIHTSEKKQSYVKKMFIKSNVKSCYKN